jgi:hypothetical protein
MSDRVTLWTLQREGATTSAEMCHVDGAWLELRYLHNDEVVARQRFQDGSELFHQAHTQRTGLEAEGWRRLGLSMR